MTEAELMTATSQAVQLSYLAGQWWLTITTALVVGIFFAGKLVPRWLFILILALYALTVFSIIVESIGYNYLADHYGTLLAGMRDAKSVAPPMLSALDPVVALLNIAANYLIFIFGSLGAVAYCITIWRIARKESSAST